jgi:hypothetical protein
MKHSGYFGMVKTNVHNIEDKTKSALHFIDA